MATVIDVLLRDEPQLGRDAINLVELLNREPVIHVTEIVLVNDLDGEIADIKPKGNDGIPAIVYTREPYNHDQVLEEIKRII